MDQINSTPPKNGAETTIPPRLSPKDEAFWANVAQIEKDRERALAQQAQDEDKDE